MYSLSSLCGCPWIALAGQERRVGSPIAAPDANRFDRPRDLVFDLVRSADLWRRRVGVLTTLGFIRRADASTTLSVAEMLLDDPEPLIHKAVGWMLREVGKRVDRGLLLEFLDTHAARMPRTMLSYATEHLAADRRAEYRGARG